MAACPAYVVACATAMGQVEVSAVAEAVTARSEAVATVALAQLVVAAAAAARHVIQSRQQNQIKASLQRPHHD